MPARFRILLFVAGAALLLLGGLVGIALALERGAFRAPLLRAISLRAQRDVSVGGELDIRIFGAGRPRVSVRDVVIGSPHWMPGEDLAHIGHLVLVFGPSLRHPLKLHGLEIRDATLYAQRGADGRANWRLKAQPEPAGRGRGVLPLQHLVAEKVRLRLKDERRRLDFDGSVTAGAATETGALTLSARGKLNGRELRATLSGDALRTARSDVPWNFRFDERSSGSRLEGTGTIPRPFDFSRMELEFAASGDSLRDLYYLVGLRLPDTGKYTATGRLVRQPGRLEFRELRATSGESDIAGSYVSEYGDGPPRFEATLKSRRLRVADIGPRAAGRQQPQPGEPRLIPGSQLPLAGLRARNGRIDFSATEFVAGPMNLRDLSTRLTIEDAVLATGGLEASTGEGKLEGALRFDASKDLPAATLDLRFTGLAAADLFRGKAPDPPLDAPLNGMMQLQASGASLRELAADARGELAFTLSEGSMRSSLAEVLGLNLRAVGLMTRPGGTHPLRCAVASFKADKGRFTASQIVIDTEPVVVHGEGSINLADERLDLRFRGQPKKLRMRLRTALEIRGTLADPAPRVEEGRTSLQAGTAVALGTLINPAAAVVAFVDPGRARDQDCAMLTAQR